MPIFNNILAGASGQTAGGAAAGYTIERSLRFNSDDSAYLNRTPLSAGNRRTWTWSGWVKRASLAASDQYIFGAQGSGSFFVLGFTSTHEFFINPTAGATGATFKSTAKFRDPSAWYHFVVAVDTTQTTASDRVKVYVNGDEITTWTTSTYPSQNTDWHVNNNVAHSIGASTASTGYCNAYLAEIHHVDGTQLAATDFGEYDDNNVWQPKEYSGTYGTNGFKLNFSDNTSTTTIAEDSSGNNNDWTANNISVASGAGNDSLLDSPTNYDDGTNVGGNYCTFNPLHPLSSGSSFTNGNLEATVFGGNDRGRQVLSTLNPSSGKYYFEITPTSIGTTYIGLFMPVSVSSIGDARVAGYRSDGLVFKDGVNLGAVASTYIANDVIGVAYDIEGAEVKFYKNGTLEYTVSGITSSLVNVSPGISCDSSGGTNFTTGIANFGQRPFAYTPPTGYVSLCTTNLDDPTIADGSTVMDVALWDGASTNQDVALDGGFSPDLVWLKNRSSNLGRPLLYDTIRGAGANKALASDGRESEGNVGDDSTNGYLISFKPDGFRVLAQRYTGYLGDSYVGWAWDAGSSTVSNTDGSITSSVRASASNGFSIVKYVGTGANATVGHGLNAAPDWIIFKDINRNDEPWFVYHSALGSSAYLFLNTTAAQTTGQSDFMNSTDPTSSVFSLGNAVGKNNRNESNFLALCWTAVEGYSAFGSYTGNGSTDGPFVYTGFQPRWLLVKNTSTTSSWVIHDTARSTYNISGPELLPNANNAEYSYDRFDILSNGFKNRTTNNASNTSGNNYIYAAIAEHPFKTARAR